jgi:multiple sugar transport system substrate-binding protein
MAAWQLIEFLSQKETLRRFYQHASSSPGRLFGEPFSRVDLADQLTGDPYVGAYIKQAPSAKSWFLSSRTFDNGLNDQIIKYYEDAINAVRQGEDAADALVATEQGITQVFSRFNLR